MVLMMNNANGPALTKIIHGDFGNPRCGDCAISFRFAAVFDGGTVPVRADYYFLTFKKEPVYVCTRCATDRNLLSAEEAFAKAA